MVNWKSINDVNDLMALSQSNQTLILFKHSERCSVSRMAKRAFEMEYDATDPVYLIHVIDERPLSNSIAEITGVNHQSPQLLIIKSGQCVYHASHDHISAADIKAFL